jgi:DNA topoisomerase VI subunit B
MSIAQLQLEEFDREAVTTRKFLERMPDDKLAWQPHPKSMTAGQLGLHMAVATGKVAEMAVLDEFKMPGFGQPNPQPKSTQEVLEAFDKSAATVRGLLPKVTDTQMNARGG